MCNPVFQDWADAYKHVHVREEDIPLQVVEWGEMFFVDRYVATVR